MGIHLYYSNLNFMMCLNKKNDLKIFLETVLAALTVLSFIIVVCAAEETTETHAPLRQTEWENRPHRCGRCESLTDKRSTNFRRSRIATSTVSGGLVMNVPFENGYLRNDAKLELVRRKRSGGLVRGGLRVWIYDEAGLAQPSLPEEWFLEQDPSLECLELVSRPGGGRAVLLPEKLRIYVCVDGHASDGPTTSESAGSKCRTKVSGGDASTLLRRAGTRTLRAS